MSRWEYPQLFALSAALSVLFYLREKTAAEPMVRLERFRERNLAISYFAALLVGASLFLGFVGITILVETPIVGLGRTVFEFGLLSLPTTMSLLVAAPFVGRAISRFGPKPVMMLASGASTIGFLLMLTFDHTYTEVMLAPIPAFVGLVAMIITITNTVVLASRKGETGIQTGMAEMFQDLGASIGPVVVATILASFTGVFGTGFVGPSGPVTVGTAYAHGFPLAVWCRRLAITHLRGPGILLTKLYLQRNRRAGRFEGAVLDQSRISRRSGSHRDLAGPVR